MSKRNTTIKKRSKSDYKKDIIDLIGIDFESLNKKDLMEVLQVSASLLPLIMSKDNKMKSDEREELIRSAFGHGVDRFSGKVHRTSDRMEEFHNSQKFKNNYWKRRSGKMPCYFRYSIGSFMSKRLINPTMTPEEESEMIKCFKKYIPFKFIDDITLKVMTSAMSKLSIDNGEFLVRQGDFSEKFYYVHTGLFGTVVSSDKCYVTEYLKPGQCFGSEYLFFGGIATKAIKCLQAATVWMMESKTFHSVCHWGLKKRQDVLERSISQTPGLQGAEATRLTNALIEIPLDQGKDVLAVTPRSSLYIVFSGQVLVEEVNMRGDVSRRTCESGGKFGQDRLFCNRFSKLYSAITLKQTVLFYITEEAFFRLFDVLELYRKSDLEIDEDDLFYRTL